MITIKFSFRDKKPLGFESAGHSGSAEAGQDIICAAISAVLQGALLGLVHYLPQGFDYTLESGYLHCRLEDQDLSEATEAILKTAILAVLNIALQYPEYISFSIQGLADWSNKPDYSKKNYEKLSSILM